MLFSPLFAQANVNVRLLCLRLRGAKATWQARPRAWSALSALGKINL